MNPSASPVPYSATPKKNRGIFDKLRGIEPKLLVRRRVGRNCKRSLKQTRRRIEIN